MAIWRDDVVKALGSIGGQGNLEDIYSVVRKVRNNELPRTWKSIVRRELEYNSSDSDSFQGRYDLFYSVAGIGGGRWGLRSSMRKTPLASDLEDETPTRTGNLVYRILRDSRLSRQIKSLHGDRCQLCGTALKLSGGDTYSEAHHIKPLGTPHNGPDVEDNILVLCPNHHAQCDFGSIYLKVEDLKVVDGHSVREDFLRYHNNKIYKS